jgi:hypothetical protein
VSDTPGLDELRELNRRLTGLLDDPHPGLVTWMMMLSETLMKMADYAGHGMISDKYPSEIRRALKGPDLAVVFPMESDDWVIHDRYRGYLHHDGEWRETCVDAYPSRRSAEEWLEKNR